MQSSSTPSAPGTAIAAGIIWIIFGGLQTLGGVMSLVTSLGAGGAGLIGAILPLLIGAGFLVVGIQTVIGKAPDTLGNGIGSIVIGVIFSAALFGLSEMFGFMGAMFALAIGLQLSLVVAGILALVSRPRYKAWAAYKRGA